jgi:hypothetical protein
MGPMSRPLDIQPMEKWLIVLIALHSVAIGIVLLFFTRWGAALGGWPETVPLFFARQGGIFHIVVAAGYLIEYFRYGGVTFLLVAKILAVAFLAGIMVAESDFSWTIPLSALGDAIMALVVYVVHRRVAG